VTTANEDGGLVKITGEEPFVPCWGGGRGGGGGGGGGRTITQLLIKFFGAGPGYCSERESVFTKSRMQIGFLSGLVDRIRLGAG